MEMKTSKLLRKKEQRIRNKKNKVENPEIPENEMFEGNTSHIARRLTKRELKGKVSIKKKQKSS